MLSMSVKAKMKRKEASVTGDRYHNHKGSSSALYISIVIVSEEAEEIIKIVFMGVARRLICPHRT